MTKNMLTVSRLAKSLNLSRTTVLYYEKQGLLKPRFIAENGYRWYGESDPSQNNGQHFPLKIT